MGFAPRGAHRRHLWRRLWSDRGGQAGTRQIYRGVVTYGGGDLLPLMALQARAAEEGRSFMSKKGGGTLVGLPRASATDLDRASAAKVAVS